MAFGAKISVFSKLELRSDLIYWLKGEIHCNSLIVDCCIGPGLNLHMSLAFPFQGCGQYMAKVLIIQNRILLTFHQDNEA